MVTEIVVLGFWGLAWFMVVGMILGYRQEKSRKLPTTVKSLVERDFAPTYCRICDQVTTKFVMVWDEDGNYLCRVCQTCRDRGH